MQELPGARLRGQRLRLTWALTLPFLLLSEPDLGSILLGVAVALPGLFLRGWAAGSIHKDRVLAVGGPYRGLRHPLYVGSFLIGLGVMIAGGVWFFPVLFFVLFAWMYGRTILAEERELALRFGNEYRGYRRSVPALLPRWSGFVGDRAEGAPGFRRELYQRNKEWKATLGTVAAFGFLWLKATLVVLS